MPKYSRGAEPVAIFIGETPVLRKYVGTELVWDGTRSAVAQALRAMASTAVRSAIGSTSIAVSASAATAAAGANLAVATASAGGLASVATATALALDHAPHADAAAIAVVAAATAIVFDAYADENFDATANAVAASASAAVSNPAATATADAAADTVRATATTIVYDALGQGSSVNSATAATATAAVVAPQMSAGATATANAATASASGKTAAPSASASATATAATATAAVNGATGTAGQYFSDSFNRTDSSSLGSDWRVDRNSQPKIATNRAQMKTMGNGDGRAGNWVSNQSGTPTGKFATDNYAVKAQLIAPTGNSATDNVTALVLAVADTFGGGGTGVMCYCVVTTGSGCGIYTQTGLPPSSGISTGQSGQTSRTTTATNISATDLIEFRRVGNVFTLYRNGSSFISWTDSGNVVSSGSTNRRWGFVVEGNYPLFNAEYRSPAIDSIEAYDL